MVRNLFWKEWHEQRWKLGFGSIILMSFAAISLRARLLPDEQVVFSVVEIAGLLLPVLVSMGLVAPERADGSLQSLRALPVSSRTIMAIKTAMGLLVTAAPVAAAAAVTCAIAGGREMGVAQILEMYARGMGMVLSLMLWMLAVGVELPTEARAGLVGTGVLIIWLLVAGGLSRVDSAWPWTLCPFGFLQLSTIEHTPSPVATVVVQALIGAGLWRWAAWRLGQEPGRTV
ncbi:MAG: ABC transporter permease [Tepidisphaerales bacterium]